MTAVPVTSLCLAELQAAILAIRELAAAVALLGARLAGELAGRDAAIVEDAEVEPARLQEPPAILDLGRTAPPSMTEIHHLRELAPDAGRTDLGDLAPLCRWHHHDLHQRHQHLHRDRRSGQIPVTGDVAELAAA